MTFKLAWRNLWRRPVRSGLTAGGMSIAIVMVMWMVSYMGGMYGQIYDVLIDQKLGHVQVHHPDYPGRSAMHDTVGDAAGVLAEVNALPESVAATGRLLAFGLVGSAETSTGGRLMGIDPAAEDSVTGLARRVKQGKMVAAGAPREAVVGVTLAEELEVGVGDEVVVILQAADGSMGSELYDVVGVARTGDGMMDRAGLWVDLAGLQELLVLPDQVHEILVLGGDMDHAPALSAAVAGAVDGDLLVRTWEETDPMTAQMAGYQTLSIGIMLAIFYGVASLGILNTMLMAVFERTRELGLLAALGLRPATIRRVVLAESFLLALVAALVGGSLGLLAQYLMVTRGMDLSVDGKGMEYMGLVLDPIIMGTYEPATTVFTLAVVFVVAVLAGLWPAWRATRMDPVEAMRQV